jgi:flagellar biosynthesis/type III secretory pathway protein FliH
MRPRARIVRASVPVDLSAPLFSLRPGATHLRRIAREVLEARLEADRVVQEARSQAGAIVNQARREAQSVAAEVAREAREQAEARVAAQWLALRDSEGARLAKDTDRVIAVAVALAERLLGTVLDLQPERIADLARVAIGEARGARRVVIEVHPRDAEMLRQSLREASLAPQTADVRSNEALAPGELRLQTDVGTIDAKLATRLERLAAALRDALH